jgi:hypothetical protein
MTITEPTTMVTDYLLGTSCVVFAFLTFRVRRSHRAMIIWVLAFSFGAAAALVGGTYHGFKLHLGATAAKSVWDSTMILIGATAAFLTAATIVSSLRDAKMEYVRWLKRGLVVSAVGFAIQKIGWDIDPNFNHNDLYHLIQIAGFWCFYEGIKRMKTGG